MKNVTLDVDNGTYICECRVDTFKSVVFVCVQLLKRIHRDGKQDVANTRFEKWELVNISLTKGQVQIDQRRDCYNNALFSDLITNASRPSANASHGWREGDHSGQLHRMASIVQATMDQRAGKNVRNWFHKTLPLKSVLTDGKVQQKITVNSPRISLSKLHGTTPDFYEERLTISTAEIADSAK